MCPNFFTARPPRSRTSRKRRDRLLNILLYPCPLVFYIDSSSGLTYSLHLLDRSLLLSRTGSPLWFSPLLLANVLTNVFIEPKKRSRCWETHGGGESRSVSHARSQRRRSFESRPATIVEFSLSLSLFLFLSVVFLRFGDRTVSELFDISAEDGVCRWAAVRWICQLRKCKGQAQSYVGVEITTS